jgi:drug/metabolite transporter (DMT)-like permease
MPKRPLYSHSAILAIIACILWATSFPVIKIGLQYTTPLRFAGIRFMIAGMMIIPFVHGLKENLLLLRRNIKPVFMISMFQTAILYVFFYLGISRTPAAVAAIIIGGGPLFIALLAHFITGKDRLTLRMILALLIGFSGIILLAVTGNSLTNGHSGVLWGIILLIIGNLAGSYGNILVSQNRTGLSPLFLNAVQIFTGGLVIFILSLFFEETGFSVKPPPYYFSLAWLSFLSAAAFSLWFIILTRPEVRVSEISVWKFIIPLLGAVLSWLLVEGENPQWNTIAGTVLIATSILIIFYKGFYKLLSRP